MKTPEEIHEEYYQWERDQEASIYNLVDYIVDEFPDSMGALEEINSNLMSQKAILPNSWFTEKQNPEATQRLINLSEELRNKREE